MAKDCCNWLTEKLHACAAERKAGASNQPYGVGPLETCPPAGSPFSDTPSSTLRLLSEDPMPAPKSPPKQIVSVHVLSVQAGLGDAHCFTISHYFWLCSAPAAI